MNHRTATLGMLGLGTLLVALVVPRVGAAPPQTQQDGAAIASHVTPASPRGVQLLAGWLGVDSLHDAVTIPDLDVLIATLPDPHDSHLDWTYDSGMEALRRAFEGAGYFADRFWLPDLPGGGLPAETDSGADSTERPGPVRYRYPAVFLFRRPDALAARGSAERTDSMPPVYLLYIVPELPTSGIYKRVLIEALRERCLLLGLTGASADTVRIVGPTFSGSVESLWMTLEQWRTRTDACGRHFSITTGTATNPRNADRFTDTARYEFRSTINSDRRLQQALHALVLRPLGVDSQHVAILRESTTEYGAGVQGDSGFLEITFPMNIARVRGAYERSAWASDTSAFSDFHTPSPVEFSLDEGDRPRETPPPHSRLTPPAVDIELEQIVRALRAHRIRYVGLLATDVRDKLFLGEALKRRLRDIQLFTFESNVLFLRSDRNLSLRGTLVFSTYPLFLEHQRWLGGSQRVPFANDGAQGVYNATLLQIGQPAAMLGYATPGQPTSADRPPVWLTAVGRSSLAPIAVYPADESETYLHVREGTVATGGAGDGAAPRIDHSSIGFGWQALFYGLSLTLLIISLYEITAAARRFSQFEDRCVHDIQTLGGPDISFHQRQAVVRTGSLFLHREFYHAFVLIALVGLFLPQATLVIADGPGSQTVMLSVFGFVVALGALVRVARNVQRILRVFGRPGWDFAFRLRWTDPWAQRAWKGEVILRAAIVGLGLMYLIVLAWLGIQIWLLAQEPGQWVVFFHRAIQLDSGVSPLVPLMISAAGFGVWSLWHLARIGLLLRMTPLDEYARHCRELTALGVPVPGNRRSSGHQSPGLWKTRRLGFEVMVVVGIAVITAFIHPAIATEVALGAAALFGVAVAIAAMDITGTGRQPEPVSPEGAGRLAAAAEAVRDRLFLVVPSYDAWLLLAVIMVSSTWFATSIQPHFETQTLPVSFHILFTFGVLGMLASIPWAAWRLCTVWRALRLALDGMGRLPLVSAFDRLPPRLARLVQLTLFRPPAEAAIDPVVTVQRRHLRNLYERNAERFASSRCGDPELAAKIAAFQSRIPADRPDADPATDQELHELHDILERAWAAEPTEGEARALMDRARKPDVPGDPRVASTTSLLRRTFAGPLRTWIRYAEEHMAVWMVEYIERTLDQIRHLALFLLGGLVLATALINSYPFHPQSRIKLIFVFIMVGTVAALVFVMVQMSRDDVLSRIAKTEPGKVKWNLHFVFNLIVFAIVPLLSLVSAEFPVVRTTIAAVLNPLVNALGSL